MQDEKLDVLKPDAVVADAVENTEIVEEEADEAPIKKPKRKKKKFIILAIVIIVVAAVAIFIASRASGAPIQSGGGYTDYTVGTRDISLSLSGTGTLNPADSYSVTTLTSGDIISAPFEEGDVVEKDSLLYQIDSSSVQTSIEQAELSLDQSRRNYNQQLKSLEDLSIKADEAGEVIELLVEAGDSVSAGQTVARIRNSSVMSLVIPFGSDDAAGFYTGQSAEITLDGSFERLPGTISKISAVEERLDGNMLVRTVTIDVSNPGGIADGQAATAMVGDIACNGSGTFSYKGEATVTASTAGDVAAVHVKEGGRVSKNQLLVTLTNDSLSNSVINSGNSLRDSELSLQNRYDQLDNYIIKSPISGTIIEKIYKEGDKPESGKILCTVFDLSYLTMTLNVDELDISSVEVGQKVTVTAEALSGRVYEGYVTKININGTTANGATAYPVTIRIDETEGLLPGMNVQASIVVSSSTDAVAIPVSALSRGNRVLVKSDSPSAQGAQGQMPEGVDQEQSEQIRGQMQTQMAASIPEGFTYVQVTPGISDGAYIEILGGLSAGDIIAVTSEAIPDAQSGFFMVGGPPPGGGAAPAGAQRTVTQGGGGPTVVTRGG